MRNRIKKWKHGQQGQAMVEFVLVLPVLMMFVFGALDFGWYFLTRNAVSQYARSAVECVPSPEASWEGEDWKKFTDLPNPSWMTYEERAIWEQGKYDGWIAFDDRYSYFNTNFNANLQRVATVLKEDDLDVSVRGGWLVAVMAEFRPQMNMLPDEDASLATPREYRYADVEVEVTYQFRPLTFVGEMFFCRDGSQTCTIVEKYREEISLGQALNIAGG